jgi:hypothetical protein
MKRIIKDIKKVIKREKLFSTLAKTEGKGAKKREKIERKKGLIDAANDSKWEEMVDNKFSKIRKKKVTKEIKKLKKINK